MGDDDARKFILARRAKFVAAALVSINAAMCGGETDNQVHDGGTTEDGSVPQPCLSPPSRDAGSDAADGAIPQPCLAPQPADASDDADADDGG